jgi:magnesium-transporting ATPase (P-type)
MHVYDKETTTQKTNKQQNVKIYKQTHKETNVPERFMFFVCFFFVFSSEDSGIPNLHSVVICFCFVAFSFFSKEKDADLGSRSPRRKKQKIYKYKALWRDLCFLFCHCFLVFSIYLFVVKSCILRQVKHGFY